ncbi:hypothetical protein [Rhizobium ruizarguesonis]
MEQLFQGGSWWILGVIAIAMTTLLTLSLLYIRNPALFLVRISNLLHVEYKARNEEGPK